MALINSKYTFSLSDLTKDIVYFSNKSMYLVAESSYQDMLDKVPTEDPSHEGNLINLIKESANGIVNALHNLNKIKIDDNAKFSFDDNTKIFSIQILNKEDVSVINADELYNELRYALTKGAVSLWFEQMSIDDLSKMYADMYAVHTVNIKSIADRKFNKNHQEQFYK